MANDAFDNAQTDKAALIDFQRARIAELELALKEIRAKARFEQDNPTGLHMTCLSLIENEAGIALAGCDTYEMELAIADAESKGLGK